MGFSPASSVGSPTAFAVPVPAPNPPLPRLIGNVIDANGLPVNGAYVEAFTTGQSILAGQSITGALGAFSVTSIFTGQQYTLVAIDPTCAFVGTSLQNLFSNEYFVSSWDFTVSGSLPAGASLSRATSGTFFSPLGFLLTSASNAARFDYDPVTFLPKGLLIEPAATNIQTQSGDLTNSGSWFGANAVPLSSAVLAPDGVSTVAYITDDVSGGPHVVYSGVSISSGNIYTFSIFAKAKELNWIYVRCDTGTAAGAFFNLASGTIGNVDAGITATIISAGNGFYRCCSTSSLTGVTGYGAIYTASANGVTNYVGVGTGLYAWGAQLKLGSIADSYIATTSSSVTRNADALTASSSPLSTQLAAGPSIWELTNISTGVTNRAIYAAGAFTFPTGYWYRSMAVYTASAPPSYLNSNLTVGAPYV